MSDIRRQWAVTEGKVSAKEALEEAGDALGEAWIALDMSTKNLGPVHMQMDALLIEDPGNKAAQEVREAIITLTRETEFMKVNVQRLSRTTKSAQRAARKI
jgi:hypothetical protein